MVFKFESLRVWQLLLESGEKINIKLSNFQRKNYTI